jgi:hypothetical protein
MKASIPKPAPELQPPVFPKTSHRLRESIDTATPDAKSQKRDNVFSKSRDNREDRGTRQIKTTHNDQTLSRGQ